MLGATNVVLEELSITPKFCVVLLGKAKVIVYCTGSLELEELDAELELFEGDDELELMEVELEFPPPPPPPLPSSPGFVEHPMIKTMVDTNHHC